MLERLSIGQLAAIFRINIQTLYYYDKIGLLVPSFRDSTTGIRNYSFKQVQKLSTILYLKKCGFTLDEIKEIESTLTPETTRERFSEKSENIMRQWIEIVKLDTALHKKLNYVKDEIEKISDEEGKILYRKKRYYLKIGLEETAYGTEDLYYYPCVVKYDSQGKVFGALIDKKDTNIADHGPVIKIPNGQYLIEYHKGPYSTVAEHKERIMNEHPELEFTGDMYSFDIVDQMNCANTEDFITRMEFQIRSR